MDNQLLIKDLQQLLINQLDGKPVEFLLKNNTTTTSDGVGVITQEGKTVRINDVIKLVLKHAFEPTLVMAKDDEFLKFMEGVTAFVEATSEEQHTLWAKFSSQSKEHPDYPKYIWNQNNSGLLVTVGKFGDMPVVLSLYKAKIGNDLVLFYHPTSMVTHSELIEKWIDTHKPKTAINDRGRLNRTNATNFSNVLDQTAQLKSSPA